jgi:hypothetical protein
MQIGIEMNMGAARTSSKEVKPEALLANLHLQQLKNIFYLPIVQEFSGWKNICFKII